MGKNILGYDGLDYGHRVVSFFKDELIVGVFFKWILSNIDWFFI